MVSSVEKLCAVSGALLDLGIALGSRRLRHPTSGIRALAGRSAPFLLCAVGLTAPGPSAGSGSSAVAVCHASSSCLGEEELDSQQPSFAGVGAVDSWAIGRGYGHRSRGAHMVFGTASRVSAVSRPALVSGTGYAKR